MKAVSRLHWHPTYWLVVAATLVAAMIRFWHLGSLPPQAWYDEVWFAVRAQEMLRTGHLYAHYGITNTAGNAGLVYLTALVQLLGIKSIVAARVVSALSGVLTVPLAYACFSELLRDEKGLSNHRRIIAALVAVVLSCLLFIVILSRVGMEPIMLLPVMLFAIWQMAHGARGNDWRSWVAAGLMVGLAQYNGPHPRLILPLAAYLIIEWLLDKRGNIPHRNIIKGTLLMGLTGLLVTLPLIVTFIQHPDWLVGRAAGVSQSIIQGDEQVSPLAAFGANGLRVLGAWVFIGDTNPRHNLPDQPILDPILAAVFLTGIGWAIWNFRRSRMARLMLVWLIGMALPAALTAEAPNMQRMIGVAPPTVALAIIGGVQIYNWLKYRFPFWMKKGWGIALGALLLFISLSWNVYMFWESWTHSPQLSQAFDAPTVNLGYEMLDRAESERVYVERLPGMYDILSFEYLFDNTTISRVDFSQCLPLAHQSKTRTNYLILADEDGRTLGQLQAIYPDSHVTIQDIDVWTAGWFGKATLLEVPASAVIPLPDKYPLARFMPGVDLYGYELSGETFNAGQTISMSIYWASSQPIDADLTPFIHIVPAGVYDQSPIAQHDGPPCAPLYPTSQWQAGEIILDWFEITLPPDLPPGAYEIAAGWYDPATMTRAALVEAGKPLADGRAIISQIRIITR